MPIDPVTDEIYSLGSFKRSYDEDLEVDLAWLAEDVKKELKEELAAQDSEEKKEEVKKNSDQEKNKEKTSKLALSLTLLAAIQKKDNKAVLDVFNKIFPLSITEQLEQLLEDITYGIRDLFNWSRVKTSLTTLSTIGVGTGLGALVGSVLLPGLGTWLGGTVGSFITSIVSTVGGSFGFGVLGGVTGSWLGSSIAKKAFKKEQNYQPSVKITDKLNEKFNIDPTTAWKINAYLYNRLQLTTNGPAKDIYRTLRKKGIDDANEEALSKIAHFFCQELKLLKKEAEHELDKDERLKLSADFEGVHNILTSLENAKLPEEAKQKIAHTLQTTRLEGGNKKRQALAADKKAAIIPAAKPTAVRSQANPPRKPPVVSSKSHLSSKVQHQMVATFEDQLKKENISITKTIEHPNANGIERTFEFSELPAISYEEVDGKEGNPHAAVALKQEDFLRATPAKQKELIKVFVAQALAYAKTSELKVVRVLACGDKELAERMAVALLEVGLIPKLDKKEFPNKEERLKLLVSARQKIHPPVSSKKVGLVMKPNRSGG